ncbi:MAG TPA: flagellar basal body-associated FliL family protein [Acidobacteriaceae bacterium]|nr:flagellar basal body-associated FliL family protein [Acidobacteriaceae bacterium]
MATTPKPTILKPPSATSAAAAGDAQDAAPEHPSKQQRGMTHWIFLGAGILFLLACVAVGGWQWRRHAHAPGVAGASAPAKAAAVKTSKLAAPVATVELPLEPFVVNLADAGGHSYARIGLTLRLAAPAGAKDKDASSKDGADGTGDLRDIARDTIISVLNQQQSADLLMVGGKDHLKQLLRQSMTARDPRLQVVDIYFTEFLVQP